MDQPTETEHLRAIQPSAVVIAAAALTALSGLLIGMTGLQLMGLIFRNPVLAAVPYAMVVAGVGGIGAATQLYRMRAASAPITLALMGLLSLGMTVWLFFSFANGLFSLFALVTPVLAFLAALFSLLSLGHCRRAAAARRELSDSGIELGM